MGQTQAEPHPKGLPTGESPAFVAIPALLPTLSLPVLSGSQRCRQSSAVPRGRTAQPLAPAGALLMHEA
jgi:hypothetical protein